MARLLFNVTSPVDNAVVGRNLTVTGRVRVTGGLELPYYSLEGVRVSLAGGPDQPAPIVSGDWTCAVSVPPAIPGGTRMQLVATAYGMVTPDVSLPGEDPEEGAPEPFEIPFPVQLVLDGSLPDTLTIDSVPSSVTTQPGVPYVLDVAGTAGDAHTGISAIRLKVDNGPFVDVVDVVGNGAGLFLWRQKAVELAAGVHHMTVQAVDGAGNVATAEARIVVRLPFEPGDAEQVFGPTRYLLDLTDFAQRYIAVDGTVGRLTRATLAARFHQPYERLVRTEHYEAATRPTVQARIAVEVLRGRRGVPAPADVDQRYRGLAYRTFLRALGTTHDELRLARTADASAREALAARLGIGLVAIRPDRLDELTVSPETITDEDLEALSGYRSTAGDPLRPATVGAKVLLWRRDAQRARWLREDEAQRDSADGPRPIIDPDLIGEDHLRGRQTGETALALWTARRAWIADTYAQVQRATRTGADPLVRFDQAIATFVGAIDLPGLAARDAAGEDIQPDLVPWELTLEAFRFLARSRALLADGVLLASEWDDIVAILVQVAKRRQFRAWRLEERRASLILEPATFAVAVGATRPADVSRWRARPADYLAWRHALAARISAAAALESSYQRVVEATEAAVLPELRDALIGLLAAPSETPDATADRLTRELMIDLHAEAGQRTTRVDQALQTVLGVVFSARSGRLDPDGSGQEWTIPQGVNFDREWMWMGTLRTWLSATRVFAYPENQLLPAVYVADPGLEQAPTEHYGDLIAELRAENRPTPDRVREIAKTYVKKLVDDGVALPAGFAITERISDSDLVVRQNLSQSLHLTTIPHREIFWLIPMALATRLQEIGQFQAALDWYRTIYAYHLPTSNRRIYHGLTVEDGIESTYDRSPDWLIEELNPHVIAQPRADPDREPRGRRNCYTRATIMAIAGCHQAFADAEFARGTAEANARARTLYETAADLLALPEARPETGPDVPFPANPVWVALHQYGQTALAKIHQGLNLAGASLAGGYESNLASQYRYGVLVERAKNLVGIAQQIEAAYLSALEQRDAKAYDALRAGQDLEVAGARVTIQELRVDDADDGIRLAELQRSRAQVQEDHYDHQIEYGLNGYEKRGLNEMWAAFGLQTAASAALAVGAFNLKDLVFANVMTGIGQSLSAMGGAFSTLAQIENTKASYKRREEEWNFQRDLAIKDGEIGDKQIEIATNQYQLAQREHELSRLQMDHAAAVVTFLATRFTDAELYEWMSGVLARVYAYFLQQATALARLAEAQLAFERQELPAGLISADYWRDESAGATAPDRRGLTGSARLVEDVNRLDQYAFDTDRRKLHLTQTFPLSAIAGFDLQQFRETGVLTFAMPQELFDREFPGHYLRLVKQISVSLLALIPSGRGVRATLSTSGVSRAVVARGPFETVTLRRPPESIAFTSPLNATGLFDLEPESGLLLPFEGMGVDTVWRLELPKAANPFDYRMIADVLLTIKYTALASPEYRQQIVRELDRRFDGDRTFSIRNQYPDAWYELNNPDTVEPDRRMKVTLPITADDLPPHIDDLRAEHLSLFVLREDALADELTIASLARTSGGQTVTAAEVTTTGGIVSTRRLGGAPWHVLTGAGPVGEWTLEIEDSPVVRSWFTDELIQDVVLVFTLAGTTPPWT